MEGAVLAETHAPSYPAEIGEPAYGFNLNLNAEQWEEFQRRLNAPPMPENPRLRKLLTTPGVCG